MINIRKLESELWESTDLLRSGSPLTSNQYCMPVLGLIFLRYAFGRIYEYCLNMFPKSIASEDGMFFTPKSLVKMRTSYDRSNSDSVCRIDK